MIRHLPSFKLLRCPVLVAFLVALVFPLFPRPSNAQLPVIRFVRDPDPAPDFQAKDLEGKDISLEAYKGKVVLLNFWATWCGPCRAELPGLIALQDKYKDHLQIVGMAVDEDDDSAVRNVMKSESINYPVAMTPNAVRMAYGGITALPTVFVINADGKVVQKHVGLFNPILYETEIRALLDLPINARVETFNDSGEIFLKHADRATMLPGVNTEGLTAEQRTVALHKFNAETCSCGCKFTLAQCRIYDPACRISTDRTAAIVKEISSTDTKAKPDEPASSPVPDAPAAAPTAPMPAAPTTSPQTR